MVDVQLARNIEDIVMFGKQEELDRLVEELRDEEGMPEDLRYALEGLSCFRAHYASVASTLSDKDRELVVRYDADWAMQIIRKIYGRCEEEQAAASQ